MGSRWRRVLSEAGRFTAVGGLATLIALILFNLSVHGFAGMYDPLLSDHVITAYVLANTVGMAVSYRGSRSWAFRDRIAVHADGGRTAYLIINIATMSLPVACLMFTRDVLMLEGPVADNIAANVVGLSLGFGARFYLFRRFVFRAPRSVLALDEMLKLPRPTHVE